MSAIDPTVEIPSAMPTTERGVVLWGAPGAGKSGLLGALYAASMRQDTDGWSAHPRDCDDAYTQQRLKDAYLGLVERANAKTGMPSGTEYAPLRLMLRRSRGRRETAALRVALIDPAGEFSTQLDLAGTAPGRALFARVAKATGVLWMFEAAPAEERGSLASEAIDARLLALQHLVSLVEQSGGVQLDIPVALCLSKIDRLPLEQRAVARADAAAALRAQLGETAFTWFEAVCPAMRCFAISSSGDIDGRVQPEGIDTVFDWLREHVQRTPSLRTRIGRLLDAIPPLPPLPQLPRPSRGAVRALGIGALAIGAAGLLGAAGMTGAAKVRSLLAATRRPVPVATAPDRRRTAGGEVEAPRSGAAMARLAAARRAHERGDWETALRTLDRAVPPAALRLAWDSLYVESALRAASDASDDREAHRLFAAARTRASEVLRRAPAGSSRLLGMRYARAVACIDGRLDCPGAQVRGDLTWALLGDRALHVAARDRLDALDAAGTP